MIASADPPTPTGPVAVIDIGNTSIGLGLWADKKLDNHQTFAPDAVEELGLALKSLGAGTSDGFLGNVAIASVVPETLQHVSEWIDKNLMLAALVVGEEIPLPIDVALEEANTVGVDRICSAAAAYYKLEQATVVIDCGTAITMDVVDDKGAFIGGSIFPGLRMQAHALHTGTALLPEVDPEKPNEPIGTNTVRAIQAGIYHGTSGAVRGMIESVATHIGRWPAVIGTGGDALLIAEACELFDTIVPGLCLQGVGLALERRMNRAVSL